MSKNGRPVNNLNAPLFGLGVYKNHILISGGGGGKNFGLPNDLKIYKRQIPLGDHVSEIVFDTELMSNIHFAYGGIPYFVAALSKYATLFSIDPKTGNCQEIKKVEADFHEKDPEVAKVRWAQDNKMFVAGGEEGVMRVFDVKFDGTGNPIDFELSHELGIHSAPINDVCLNAEKTMAVSSSTDKTCRIYSLSDNKCIKKLSFSEGVGLENLQFKGALFSPDSRFLYTLATKFKGRSYLIKWNAKDVNFDPVDTTPSHNGPSCIMEINSNGRSMAVGSNDGHVIAIDLNSMTSYRSEKKHKMPINSIVFTEDSSNIITVSADNTYEVTANTAQTGFMGMFIKL